MYTFHSVYMIILNFTFSVVPIFMVSSLTGYNLAQLESFLNSIPLTQLSPEREDEKHQKLPEFQVFLHVCVYVVVA